MDRIMRLLAAGSMLAFSAGLAHGEEGQRSGPPEPEEGVRFGLGAALIVQAEPYRDLDDDIEIFPIPLISVETKRFLWQGPRLAYKLVNDDRWALDLVAAWRFYGVDPDDSDFLEGMEERKGTVDAGLRAAYSTPRTVTELRGAVDTLDRHDGYDLAFDFGLPQRVSRWVITPSVGVNYLSEDFVDYYFGVEPNEATAVRPEYTGNDAWNVVVGLEVFYPINPRWVFFGGLRHEFLDSGITDSPIVEDDTRTNLFLGFSRRMGRSPSRGDPGLEQAEGAADSFRSARGP